MEISLRIPLQCVYACEYVGVCARSYLILIIKLLLPTSAHRFTGARVRAQLKNMCRPLYTPVHMWVCTRPI